MGTGALTGYLDVAQVTLYVFWLFFFGLIFYLRREDRREGYPTEDDQSGRVDRPGPILDAEPKVYNLPGGGTFSAPNDERDTRDIAAERVGAWTGSPLEPSGDPMTDGVGPASFCERSDEPDTTHEGEPLIAPMRVATDFSIEAREDPRGYPVVASDGEVAGKVKELWVDRADQIIRYLEVELPAAGEDQPAKTVLLPMALSRVDRAPDRVRVASVKAAHFDKVPALANPDQITLREEDKICAFFASGRLYADASRLGPWL